MTEDRTSKDSRKPRRRRLWWIAGALVIVVVAAGWLATGHRHWHGADHGRFVEKRVERMLDKVDATDSQRREIRAIAEQTVADIGKLKALAPEARQALVDIFSRETIDREALESLRLQWIATMDGTSRQLLVALADTAEVLDMEQRAVLIERFDRSR